MKVKKKDLRKRLPQIPINYPGPDVIPFDYETEKAKVENLCKRLADNEVETRDAVLAELPRYIKEVCAPFVKDNSLAEAEKKAIASVDLTDHLAGFRLWEALLKDDSLSKLALVFEKLCLGLFYCMWHSDKPLVQHECALQIVLLVDAPPTPLLKELFVRSMLRTLAVHWGKIDQWRLDKYLALVRKFCYQVLCHIAKACKAAASKAVATHSPNSKPTATPGKKRASAGPTHPTAEVVHDESTGNGHISLLRIAASFQHDVIGKAESVGLTMHICDLMLTEMVRCVAVDPHLFVEVAKAIPLYAMQRGDFIDKRVMDNFVVPVAAGQLEARSEDFSLAVGQELVSVFEGLSVSRATHFSVRPLMVESQRMIENYVGSKTQPDLYEPTTKRDETRRIAQEVRAAEELKMNMSRIAMGHAAAAGALRAQRRASVKAQPKSKRNPRWKKN